jgi:hypothetical protein
MKPSACVQLERHNFAKKTLQNVLTSLLGSAILILQIKLGKGADIMNKEEILSKARKENNGVDEVERAAKTEAARISMATGAAACMLLNFLDALYLETDVIGEACWIIYGIMVSTSLLVQGIELKKKSYLIGSMFTTAFVILLTVFLFVGVCHA